MNDVTELDLLNQPSEIARAQDELEQFAAGHHISGRPLHAVQLALEEHLSNILKYGHQDALEHRIQVRFAFRPSELRIEIEDDGCAFDPLNSPTPDLSQPIEERPIGGLGIHMMRKSLDGLEYRRVDGKNTLRMIKQV